MVLEELGGGGWAEGDTWGEDECVECWDTQCEIHTLKNLDGSCEGGVFVWWCEDEDEREEKEEYYQDDESPSGTHSLGAVAIVVLS